MSDTHVPKEGQVIPHNRNNSSILIWIEKNDHRFDSSVVHDRNYISVVKETVPKQSHGKQGLYFSKTISPVKKNPCLFNVIFINVHLFWYLIINLWIYSCLLAITHGFSNYAYCINNLRVKLIYVSMGYVFSPLPFKQVHLHIIQISETQTSKKCLVNVNNHLKW